MNQQLLQIKETGEKLNMVITITDDFIQITYYHPDHLGSTTLITNSTGDITEEIFYLPFGELYQSDSEERFQFTGKEKDSDTGFSYYGARYYDSRFRHFLQPDSIIPDIYNPQALNRYSYVLNNPYKYVDPNGESPHLAVALGAGAVVGIVTGVITYQQTGDLNKAIIAGTIVGGGTALSIALPTVGAQLAIGAIESIALQTTVEGKDFNQISPTETVIDTFSNLAGAGIKKPILSSISHNPNVAEQIIAESIATGISKASSEGAKSTLNEFEIKKLLDNEEFSTYYLRTQKPITPEVSSSGGSSFPLGQGGSGGSSGGGSGGSGSGGGSSGGQSGGGGGGYCGWCGCYMSCPPPEG